jgi:HSP20 family molecular chaperone IbpA
VALVVGCFRSLQSTINHKSKRQQHSNSSKMTPTISKTAAFALFLASSAQASASRTCTSDRRGGVATFPASFATTRYHNHHQQQQQQQLQHQRVFETLFSATSAPQQQSPQQQQVREIPYELAESASGYELAFDFPGCSISDVNLILEQGAEVLRVSGRRPARNGKATPLLQRRIGLSRDIDTSSITAAMSNGVLTVKLPKVQPQQAIEIPIAMERSAWTGSSSIGQPSAAVQGKQLNIKLCNCKLGIALDYACFASVCASARTNDSSFVVFSYDTADGQQQQQQAAEPEQQQQHADSAPAEHSAEPPQLHGQQQEAAQEQEPAQEEPAQEVSWTWEIAENEEMQDDDELQFSEPPSPASVENTHISIAAPKHRSTKVERLLFVKFVGGNVDSMAE